MIDGSAARRARPRFVRGAALLGITCAAVGPLAVRSSGVLRAQTPGGQRPGEIVAPRPAPAAASAGTSGDKNGDPNKGTGVIRGRILLANGRPARRASIQLASSGPARATAADDDGKYELTELPADSYRLSAGKPGYLVLEYGQKRAFERGRVIELRDGETADKIDLTLPASGAVAGRIVDENGDPVEAVTVRLLQLRFSAGRRQALDVGETGPRATDDTGSFRIYGVPPGDYLVAASLTDRLLPDPDNRAGGPPASAPGYATTYYPGVIGVADAQIVRVGLSQEVLDVDFALAQAPTARLSGLAVNALGQPAGVFLARSQRSGGASELPRRGISTADGGFRFDNVAPGEYVLQTAGSRRDPAIEADFASAFVVVDGHDVSDIRLQGTSGSTVSGRVTFEGLAQDAKTPSVILTAWPVDFDRSPMSMNDIARTRVGDDGRFALGGLQGPRRLRLSQAPSSWSLKAVRVNGFDVTDDILSFGTARESLSNVEVVLSKAGPTIAGSVSDAQGQKPDDYTVVAFSTDTERWYARSRFLAFVRAKRDGTFQLAGLAPGEYYVAAVDSLQGAEGWGEWQDPEFLRAIASQATRVSLADGQGASVALRLIPR